MAIKKSQLYSSLWSSCDELRGGMDASQYKDYVLVMLFVKYVSDKYANEPFAPITVPEGASFKDMVALKGKTTIGDDINKKIIGPIAEANKLSDMPDFNDVNKLGSGKEMVDRLTNLIAIFENKDLDFSKNRADGDDIRKRQIIPTFFPFIGYEIILLRIKSRRIFYRQRGYSEEMGSPRRCLPVQRRKSNNMVSSQSSGSSRALHLDETN
jgi:hypothetical protein